jgi:type II secretory pathway component PulF
MLPSVMLLAAIFLAPLPQLFTGTLAIAGYLSKTFGMILFITLALLFFLKLPAWFRDGWLKWLNPDNAYDRLLIKVPLFGRAELRRQRTNFLKVLCLLLESGIPVFNALPLAADTVSNRHLRDNFSSLAELLESGETLVGAFSRSAFMDGESLLAALTGEATGDSGQAICRYAEMEQQSLKQYYSELATWIPRLIYILVLILMAWQIIAAFPGAALVGQATFQLTHS